MGVDEIPLSVFYKIQNDEKLAAIKECADPEIHAINKFMIDIASSAYQENQNLMVIVVLRLIRFHFKHGYTDGSIWGFAGISTLTYSALGLSKLGFRLWDLTIRLNKLTHSPVIKAKLNYTLNAFYAHWRIPLRDTLDDLINVFKECFMNGDQNFGGYAISTYFWKISASGMPLPEVLDHTKEHINYLKRTKTEIGLSFAVPRMNTVHKLAGIAQSSEDLNDSKYDGKNYVEELIKVGNQTSIAYYYNSKLPLYYYFEDYKEGLKWGEEGLKYQANILGQYFISEWYFYMGLIISSCYDDMNDKDRKKYDKIFKTCLKWFRHWVKGCPENFVSNYIFFKVYTI
ncbi:MAG: hypothetical protein IPO92_11315 [Saprospiraceae bacterium]|nr:hypothetical protein [Saprospiraceae bacterium]